MADRHAFRLDGTGAFSTPRVYDDTPTEEQVIRDEDAGKATARKLRGRQMDMELQGSHGESTLPTSEPQQDI